MSPANRYRVSKRVNQACENCRRKKTRCPGERPACSTCTRLFQVCKYADSNGTVERLLGGDPNLEGRLLQLEEKMELILERAIPESTGQTETPKSCGGPSIHRTTSPSSRAAGISFRLDRLTETQTGKSLDGHSASSPFPPKDVVVEAIELYFRYCHMQPLWLLDREDFSSPEECCEETIFALLALTIRYSTRPFFEGRSMEMAQRYGEIARDHIMFRITKGTVQLSTIQSLCLLAFSNFVSKDTHLAWLHIDLANSLSKCAGLDIESNQSDFTPRAEAKRRVFWSIHFLSQLYGPRTMMLTILEDIDKPKYVGASKDPQRESSIAPSLTPQESTNDMQSQNGGIWTYMVQLSTLWNEVRNYVAHCADGSTKPPWSPDSGYAVIGAHLMDLETRLPTSHRYDSVRFWDRSKEELQCNRGYWSPWVYLQFTYHAIHSMLNHPFLYSSRPQQSAQLAVPNTFWKTSSELALIHTTWTVRLIDMVSEKEYRVTDPFIGHCVAIAATIHLYYCRAADSRVRETAQNKLANCMRFLGELGAVWPVCQVMCEKLDSLVRSAFASSQLPGEQESSRRTVSINTALMWDILDYTRPGKSTKSGRGLFHLSFCQDAEEEDADEQTVETQIFHHPTREVDLSNGGQELPPFSDSTIRRTPGSGSLHGQIGHSAPAEDRSMQHSPQLEIVTWPGAGFMGNASIMDITHDPFFQFQDHGSPYLGLWEIGNL